MLCIVYLSFLLDFIFLSKEVSLSVLTLTMVLFINKACLYEYCYINNSKSILLPSITVFTDSQIYKICIPRERNINLKSLWLTILYLSEKLILKKKTINIYVIMMLRHLPKS